MNFKAAVGFVIDIEGGEKVVEHPDDNGLITKFGIALRSHPWIGREGIRNLTREAAEKIYLAEYWMPSSCEEMPSAIRLAVFDASVHHGTGQSIRFLQRALNKIGATLEIDGRFGPKTRRALRNADPKETLIGMLWQRSTQMRVYEDYPIFGEGWEKRVYRIAVESNAA